MHAIRQLTGIVAALLTATAIAACGSDDVRDPPDPPPNTVTTSEITTGGSGGSTPTQDGGQMPRTTAEVWQWAIGRNVFDDPYLQGYASDLGRSSKTDVYVHEQGFMLDLDTGGTVQAVVLYNDEVELGWEASESAFSAYQGTLPGGLSWDDTPASLGAAFGDDNQSGGWGTAIWFGYRTADGYDLEVRTTAGHEWELEGARIHSITVTRS